MRSPDTAERRTTTVYSVSELLLAHTHTHAHAHAHARMHTHTHTHTGPRGSEWADLAPLLLSDSLVVLCFTQTSIVTKIVMRRRRITMATATATPMMTAVSTLPEPGVSGVSE